MNKQSLTKMISSELGFPSIFTSVLVSALRSNVPCIQHYAAAVRLQGGPITDQNFEIIDYAFTSIRTLGVRGEKVINEAKVQLRRCYELLTEENMSKLTQMIGTR